MTVDGCYMHSSMSLCAYLTKLALWFLASSIKRDISFGPDVGERTSQKITEAYKIVKYEREENA